MNSARLRAYFELILAVVIWGAAASVIKFGLEDIPPFTFLAYRCLITTIVLLPFFLREREKHITFDNIFFLIFIAFLGSTLNLSLLFYGTKFSTSLDSSLITATAPILVILAGVLFLKEHITHKEKVGIGVTLLGTLVIMLQSFFESGPHSALSVFGNILLFISNIAFTGYLIFSKEIVRQKISPFTLTFMTFLVGFITTLPLTVFEIQPASLLPAILHLNLATQASVFYMALLSGALAYFLYQKAQKTIEASEASVFQYLQPVATAPIAVLWLGEKITIPMVIGSILVVIGVFLAEVKKKRYN